MESNVNRPAFGVLAGGKSCRMGADKARLMLEGRSFLDRVLEAGQAFPERLVSVSAAADDGELERLRAMGVRPVQDTRADVGPLEGIRQILLHTARPACLITATDMPFLTSAFLAQLCDRYSGRGNLALTFRGYPEPLCSIYSRACLPEIDALLEQGIYKPARLFRTIPTVYVLLEDTGFPETVIRNINRAEEYRSLLNGGQTAKEDRT